MSSKTTKANNTTKANKFNEIFESANRLRTVRNAPNPFLVVRRSDGRLVEREKTTDGQSVAREQEVHES
jgi:hypothetical protein